jgi:hypothetical protein
MELFADHPADLAQTRQYLPGHFTLPQSPPEPIFLPSAKSMFKKN